MNAIPARLRANVNDGVAGTGRRRVKNSIGAHKPNAHGVDENIVIVARVEVGLAPHRRDADTVAVIADASDDALNEVARFGMIG